MTEYSNHRPWDTETLSHKISHDKYHEKRAMVDKIKHEPSMLQRDIRHTQTTIESQLLRNPFCLVGAEFFEDYLDIAQFYLKNSRPIMTSLCHCFQSPGL